MVNIVVIFFIIIARSEQTPEGQENSHKLCRQQRVNRTGSQLVVPVRRFGAEVVLPTCIPRSTGGESKGERYSVNIKKKNDTVNVVHMDAYIVN